MAKRRMGIMTFLFVLCLCLLFSAAAPVAVASEPVAIYQPCSLTLVYGCDGQLFGDVPVKLYKIADVSQTYEYTIDPDFAPSGLTLQGIRTTGEWDVIRDTLEAYIVAHTIQEDLVKNTDDSGRVTFDELVTGLYLAVTEPVKTPEMHYRFQPALVSLPGKNVDGLWQYDVIVAAKPELVPPADPDEELTLNVLKLWKGDENAKERPKAIQVEIYRNGVYQQTVSLSADNRWSYHWTVPKDDAVWTVIERNVPSDYVQTLEKRGDTFVLTNHLEPKEEEPEDEEQEKEDRPDKPSDNKPETGDTSHVMLYLILLFLSGTAMILLSMTGKRRRHEEEY